MANKVKTNQELEGDAHLADKDIEEELESKKHAQFGQKMAQGDIKHGKNQKRIGRTQQATGKGMKAAGKGMDLAGRGIQAVGKGIQAAGKAATSAGSSMMSAGAALSGTGIGAIAGVPLMALGALTAGGGIGMQGAGMGVNAAGKGTSAAGKGITRAGDRLDKRGKNNVQKGKNNIKEGNKKLKESKIAEKVADKNIAGAQKRKDDAGSELQSRAKARGASKLETALAKRAPLIKGKAGLKEDGRKKETKTMRLMPGKKGPRVGVKKLDMMKRPGLKDAKAGAEAAKPAAMLRQGFAQARQIAREAKRKAAMAARIATGDFSAASAAIGEGVKTTTGVLLKYSWLFSLKTFGLSLIYTNFHFIIRYIAGVDKFANFGEEWSSGLDTKFISAATSKLGSRKTQYLEFAALGLLDVLIILIIAWVIISIFLPPLFLIFGIIGFKEILGGVIGAVTDFFTNIF